MNRGKDTLVKIRMIIPRLRRFYDEKIPRQKSKKQNNAKKNANSYLEHSFYFCLH